MKRVLLTAAVLVFSAGAALAADPMASFYGNTLTVQDSKGALKLWYKADKTFTGDDHGTKISGTWDVTGDQMCSVQTTPPPAAGMGKHCGPVENRKVGDKWESTHPDGTKVSLSLTAGG